MTDRTPSTAAGRTHLQWLLAGDDVFPEDALNAVLAIEDEARAPLREALRDAFREAKARIAVSHEAPPARAPLDVDRLRAAAQAVVDWSSDPHHRLDPGTESRVNALRAALEEPPT